jgi:AcrR family transcriptional regulator
VTMPARARRLSVDERREQLIELGIRIFSEHAYDVVSTGQIAERAGISKGLLYHYFPSKRHFYVATVQEVARRLQEATIPDPELDFSASLTDSLSRFLDFVERNAPIYRALMRSGVGSDREVEAILEARRELECQRVFSRLEVEEPPPVLRSGVYGWVGFVETATLDWLERRDYPKRTLLALLVAALDPILETARRLPSPLLDR